MKLRFVSAGLVVGALLLAAPAGALAFEPLSSFGSHGEGAAQLAEPSNLAIASNGDVYVADYGNNRIDVFSSMGGFLYAFGKDVDPAGGDLCTGSSGCQKGEASDGAGAMNEPEAVALNAAGDVFVADQSNNRIDVYSAAGVFLYAFGSEVNAGDSGDVCTTECQQGSGGEAAGEIPSPDGVAIDSSGHVYVTDYGNNRIDVFDEAGSFLYAFGREVDPAGGEVCTDATGGCHKGEESDVAGAMNGPYDVALSTSGDLLISDVENNRIDVFTTDGSFLYAFGREVDPAGGEVCTEATGGCQKGEASDMAGALDKASALTVDGGDVYVADVGESRVDEFTVAGSFVRAFGAGVVGGSEAFQVCTTICHKGLETTIPGATPEPYGLAIDCRGAIYVSEAEGNTFARVERFGEAGTAFAPCPASVSTPTPAPVPIHGVFKLGRPRLNRAKGTVTLPVTVPGPGFLSLKGKGLYGIEHRAKVAGTLKFTIKPKNELWRKLNRRGRGTTTIKVGFVPDSGETQVLKKKLVFRRARHR